MMPYSPRAVLTAFLVFNAPAVGLAQAAQTVVVSDDRGDRVPFAVVTIVGGISQIADDSGRARFQLAKRDSVRLQVRRIGHREFVGWVNREGETFAVTIPAIARRLDALTVTATREQTPLERTGFYERAARVQRGAIVAEFITPEELNARNAAEVSRILDGRRSVRVARWKGKPALTGRGGCAMTILVDGQQMKGTVEEYIEEDVPQSITQRQSSSGRSDPVPMSVDDLVNGLSVMAIEVYPSTANAPAELQTLGGRGSCGIVAIWTGPRQ